eukprot:3468416-Pyramimonas_sp.AAC.1
MQSKSKFDEFDQWDRGDRFGNVEREIGGWTVYSSHLERAAHKVPDDIHVAHDDLVLMHRLLRAGNSWRCRVEHRGGPGDSWRPPVGRLRGISPRSSRGSGARKAVRQKPVRKARRGALGDLHHARRYSAGGSVSVHRMTGALLTARLRATSGGGVRLRADTPPRVIS